MSLNFGQIPPLTTELAALERLKNRCHHVISVDIDPIFFKHAGNKDMHNIMNEFEFRPDRTTDYGVSCPWASKKYPYRPYNGENGVSTFSLLFLIGSFWYFHVTRTSIKAWMSLNFLKWDLTLAHWTQVSNRCPLGYLFFICQHFLGSYEPLKNPCMFKISLLSILNCGFSFICLSICFILWATPWENLFVPYANNKGADQPAHPRSLISAFVVRCLDTAIPLLAIAKISRP